MPTYQYACTQCQEQLEAVQSFTDPALTECPACGGALRKVFSAVGVVFKGSGFYKNDSRAAPAGAGKGDGKAEGSKGDGKADAGKAEGSKAEGGKGDAGKAASGRADGGKGDSGKKDAGKKDGAAASSGSANAGSSSGSKAPAGKGA